MDHMRTNKTHQPARHDSDVNLVTEPSSPHTEAGHFAVASRGMGGPAATALLATLGSAIQGTAPRMNGHWPSRCAGVDKARHAVRASNLRGLDRLVIGSAAMIGTELAVLARRSGHDVTDAAGAS